MVFPYDLFNWHVADPAGDATGMKISYLPCERQLNIWRPLYRRPACVNTAIVEPTARSVKQYVPNADHQVRVEFQLKHVDITADFKEKHDQVRKNA